NQSTCSNLIGRLVKLILFKFSCFNSDRKLFLILPQKEISNDSKFLNFLKINFTSFKEILLFCEISKFSKFVEYLFTKIGIVFSLNDWQLGNMMECNLGNFLNNEFNFTEFIL